MVRYIYICIVVLVLIVVSHAADQAVMEYGKKEVAEYLASDENPSRALYTSNGELLAESPADYDLIVRAADQISIIDRDLYLVRIFQQILLCMIFSLVIAYRRS